MRTSRDMMVRERCAPRCRRACLRDCLDRLQFQRHGKPAMVSVDHGPQHAALGVRASAAFMILTVLRRFSTDRKPQADRATADMELAQP